MKSRFFRVGTPRRRICVYGCAVAIIAIWINILKDLSADSPAPEVLSEDINNALSETATRDSIMAASPLFVHGDGIDLSDLVDPFWPRLNPELCDTMTVVDTTAAYSTFNDIRFYGTLLRGRHLVGLIGDTKGISSLVCTGDSLVGGIVETITEERITVWKHGEAFLLERRP